MTIEGEVITADEWPRYTKAQFATRCENLKDFGCVCCIINMEIGLRTTGFGIPEIHHLNEAGRAGNKRRGDRFTIPLCAYHHRGKLPPNYLGNAPTPENLTIVFGPSWAYGSKLFRMFYPSDDELLAKVDGE